MEKEVPMYYQILLQLKKIKLPVFNQRKVNTAYFFQLLDFFASSLYGPVSGEL